MSSYWHHKLVSMGLQKLPVLRIEGELIWARSIVASQIPIWWKGAPGSAQYSGHSSSESASQFLTTSSRISLLPPTYVGETNQNRRRGTMGPSLLERRLLELPQKDPRVQTASFTSADGLTEHNPASLCATPMILYLPASMKMLTASQPPQRQATQNRWINGQKMSWGYMACWRFLQPLRIRTSCITGKSIWPLLILPKAEVHFHFPKLFCLQ